MRMSHLAPLLVNRTENPFHQEIILGFKALKYYTYMYFDRESVIYKKLLVHYNSIRMYSYVDDFCQSLMLQGKNRLVTTKLVKAVSQDISLEISSQQNTNWLAH